MGGLSRRGFLTRSTAAVAAVAGLIGFPELAVVSEGPAPAGDMEVGELTEPMVAHISNLAQGEVSVLVGTREVVVQDAQLVARLVQAARQ